MTAELVDRIALWIGLLMLLGFMIWLAIKVLND